MAEKTWLEVSLTVDGELAEAVSEVLGRYIPNGVVIEATQDAPDPGGQGHSIGPLRVCGYLESDTNPEDTRQRIEEGLWYLSRISPMPAPHIRIIEEADWVDAWKGHYHPIQVGQRMVIIPSWLPPRAGDRLPIRIEPGRAFGTGTHPSTQLCIALAEKHVQPGRPVIDVGCGSGILSIAALKLGANHALGVDVEAESVQATQQNAELSGVSAGMEVGLGSVAEICQGRFSIRQAPVVLANILAPVLIHLLHEGMADLIAPGGCTLFSGILAEQEAGILAAAERHGLDGRERLQRGDWVALCLA